jgi:hypothetical protein
VPRRAVSDRRGADLVDAAPWRLQHDDAPRSA